MIEPLSSFQMPKRASQACGMGLAERGHDWMRQPNQRDQKKHRVHKQHWRPSIRNECSSAFKPRLFFDSCQMTTHLLYPCHFSLFLLEILLSFLSLFVKTAYEAVPVAFVSKAILVLLSRRSIVCNIDFTILAVVFLVRDPVLRHEGTMKEVSGDRVRSRLQKRDRLIHKS